MHKMKEENDVLDLLKKAQGYLKGHFCLTSGNTAGYKHQRTHGR